MTKTPSHYRARIIRDTHAMRPDQDMDMVIEVHGPDSYWDVDMQEVYAIESTNAWDVTVRMCHSTGVDFPDLHDRGIRQAWLEAVKDEVKVRRVPVDRGFCYYVATNPERCEVLGVPWDKVDAAMDQEIELLQHHIAGDVYGYIIEEGKTCGTCNHTEWEEVDSCWGFYGSDIQTNGMLDNVPSEMKEVLLNAEWVD